MFVQQNIKFKKDKKKKLIDLFVVKHIKNCFNYLSEGSKRKVGQKRGVLPRVKRS